MPTNTVSQMGKHAGLPSTFPSGLWVAELEKHRSSWPHGPCRADHPLGERQETDTLTLAFCLPQVNQPFCFYSTLSSPAAFLTNWSCMTANTSKALRSTAHDMHVVSSPAWDCASTNCSEKVPLPCPRMRSVDGASSLTDCWDLLRSHKTWVRLAEEKFLCTESALPKACCTQKRIHLNLQ